MAEENGNNSGKKSGNENVTSVNGGKLLGSALLGEALEAITTGGIAAGGTALMLGRLRTAGVPGSLLKTLENKFQTKPGGLGWQDEVNNESGLLALFFMSKEEIQKLLPQANFDGLAAYERVTHWLQQTLSSRQRAQFIGKAGMKFGDVYASLRAPFVSALTGESGGKHTETMDEREEAIEKTQKSVAETYLPYAYKGPTGDPQADQERTDLAISIRWISKGKGLNLKQKVTDALGDRSERSKKAHNILEKWRRTRSR